MPPDCSEPAGLVGPAEPAAMATPPPVATPVTVARAATAVGWPAAEVPAGPVVSAGWGIPQAGPVVVAVAAGPQGYSATAEAAETAE